MSRHSYRVASCLVSLFIAASLTGQQFAAQRHRLLPDQAAGVQVSGDLDNDGDLDLVGAVGYSLRIGRNNGEGRFVAEPLPFTVPPRSIALADIDGDGDLDIAVGSVFPFFSYIHGGLYRNDGPFGFVDISSQWPTVSESPKEVLFVDYDGDGDQDIVTANPINAAGQFGLPYPSCKLYLNNGSGTFTDMTATMLPTVLLARSVAAGDIDGDGDVDLVFAGDSVRVFVQNSNGVAVETPGLVPHLLSNYQEYEDIELFDFDLDGDLDLVGASNAGVLRFANNGLGAFAVAQTIVDPRVIEIRPADIDGDSRVDLVAVRGWAGVSHAMAMWRNTAAGFVDVTSTHLEAAAVAPKSVSVFDADNDGDLDLWGGTAGQGVLWHNDGQGHLLQLSGDGFSAQSILYAAHADYDGDGDMDVAAIEEAITGGGNHLFISENAGNGPTARRKTLVSWGTAFSPQCLAWTDVDLDGDMDLFVGSVPATIGPYGHDMLFHNVGGTFVNVTSAHLPSWGGTRKVATGDLNGDGILDLVGGSTGVTLYVSDGVGGYTNEVSMLPASNGYLSGAAVLDFDGDGDLDIVQSLATWFGTSGSVRLLENNWPAPFVDVTAAHTLPTLEAWSVATIDIDRDGADDLLIGNNAAVVGGNGLVLLRSTGGTFVDETAARVPQMYAAGWVSVTDLDGDGWSDVILRDRWQNNPRELRNQNGVLQSFAGNPFLDHPPWHTAAADFDGDGDQDLLVSRGTLRNRTRDLQAAVPPRLGLHGELVMHAHDGDGANAQVSLLGFSSGLLQPGIVLAGAGTLRLDPATARFHSAHVIATGGGEASVTYLVPALPVLLGSTVYAQALFMHTPSPASWHLSNLVKLPVRL